MKFTVALVILMIAMPSYVMSQSTASDEIVLFQNAFGMEKRVFVDQYMNLDNRKSQSFWPIYQRYEDERTAIVRERLLLINDYLGSFETLDEAAINEMVKKRLRIDRDLNRLQTKYYKTFRKATSTMDAAKFLQLDDFIHITIFQSILDGLPLLDKK